MRTLSLAAAAVLVAASVSAQEIKLHGYPGKDSYASIAELPKLDEAQIHWDDITIPGIQSPDESQHGHIGLVGCRKYAEVSAPFTCGISVRLFNTTAHVGQIYTQMVRSIVWDETGTETPPVMQGALGHGAAGTRIWNGTVTFDPALMNVKHGWISPLITASVGFPDGRIGYVAQYYPFFSMIDPSAPERNSAPLWRASCKIDSNHGTNYGDTVVEYGTLGFSGGSLFFPIAPIASDWVMPIGTNGYGSTDLPMARWEQRRDLNFHEHNPGVLMQSKEGFGAIPGLVTWDPAEMGPGTHRVAQIRFQEARDEQIACLLVGDVTVAGVPPPPPPPPPPPALCTDPTATNNGQPLPCVFPPPLPLVLTIFNLEITCDRTAGTCKLVVK